ncbi:MAG: lipid-A-disaccharide synthase [Myxococcota bacterium]
MRVFLSTADASGDMHAADLLRAMNERCPGLEAFGLGGEASLAAGLEPVVPQGELAIAGLVEVLGSIPRVVRAYTALRRALVTRRPDLVVLVDSPDLNLRFAAVARRRGIPVFYYVAPQVWAWRPGRLRQLARRTDRVAVIFPFEEALLRGAGIAATFVGHPLAARMARLRESLEPKQVAAELGLDLERPILALLPGSRRNELAGNLPLMLEAARLLLEAIPDLQVQLLLAPTLVGDPPELPDEVRLVRGRSHEAMAISSCVIAASGTVTLEATLLGVPLVVTHRVSRLSFEIVRRVATVPSSCMTNLIADAGIVPERIQFMARPTAVAALAARLIRVPQARTEMFEAFGRVAEQLGRPDAARHAADLALEAAGRAPAAGH